MATKNPHEDYTFGDRFQRFLKKLITFAKTARTSQEIDNSPDQIFDGEKGELLVKFKNNIFYRKNDSNEFVSLNDEYSELMESNKYVLSQGVNKNVSWTKSGERGNKQWEFLGYFSPICDVDCCVTGSGDPI